MKDIYSIIGLVIIGIPILLFIIFVIWVILTNIKLFRKLLGGTWYRVHVWDAEKEVNGYYWTREETFEYSDSNKGYKILKTEVY